MEAIEERYELNRCNAYGAFSSHRMKRARNLGEDFDRRPKTLVRRCTGQLLSDCRLRVGTPTANRSVAITARGLRSALPWGENLFGHQGLFEHRKLEYLAVLFSGWINPTFLLAVLFVSRTSSARVSKILAIVRLALIPSCWLFFTTRFLSAGGSLRLDCCHASRPL
jgi:hypothetical protein